MKTNYQCSCYMEYPNISCKKANGKWICVDKYEKVEGWKSPRKHGCKTHCRRKDTRRSEMKRGEKYIIEIAEIHTHYDDNGKPYPAARIKGFSTLTFDQKGLDRLEKHEPNNVKAEPLNCKFVVTDNGGEDDLLTNGKLYEVNDGYFETDDGDFYPCSKVLTHFDELEFYLSKDGSFSNGDVHIIRVVEG